jgi:hypothetical protein
MTKAFNYYHEYNKYSDSLSQEENIKKITQLQMQYEFDKQVKQREIEQAKQDAIQKRIDLYYAHLGRFPGSHNIVPAFQVADQ